MKLLGIARFELTYQARRLWLWLVFAVLLALSFLVARDHSLADALYEDFFANSPFAIAKTTVVGGVFWLLSAGAIAGEAAARDVSTGMYPLVYTAPVSKAEYLGGRFLAAFALNALLLLAVQLGILLGVYSPGVAATVIGPFRPAAFLTAYAYIALPNAFAATTIQFWLALRTGRGMAGYVGSLLLLFMGFFVATILNWLVRRGLGTLLDPVGINLIVEDLAHLWTTTEKSWRLLTLDGPILTNRLVWLGVGAGALVITYVRFRFEHRAEGSQRSRSIRRRHARAPSPAAIGLGATASIAVPDVARTFGVGIQLRKTLAIARMSFRAIAGSLAGLALLIAVPLMTVIVLLDQMSALGVPLVPRTALILRELTGGLSAGLAAEPSRWVIVPLFIVFFAGELIWREREAGLGELTDSMPGSEWTPLVGKLLGLGLVLAAFMACLTTAGIVAQAIMGYHDVELGLYLKILFGLQLPEYLLFAVLALAIHVVVNQKYIAHLVAILAYAFLAAFAGLLGIEHNLLIYLDGPAWSYTEIRGFGASIAPWLWFKLYWAAWALLIAVAARLLWVRGSESALALRLRESRARLTRATIVVSAIAVALIASSGGFIFYNTNVLNEYRPSSEVERLRAEYERRYRRYESVPQPLVTRTTLRVEIYPDRRAVEIHGAYRLVNAGAVAIDSVHIATSTSGAETGALSFDRPATLELDDSQHGHRIYVLGGPLAPGDSLGVSFEVRVEPHGFANDGVNPAVVSNGTFFTNRAWLPQVGYQRFRELLGPAERREHGLMPRPLLAELYDDEGRAFAERSGGSFDAVIGTEHDQTPVAPGALRRVWTENGRRYFHYATSAPIGGDWAILSAKYAVREARWHDVAIRLYHHPEHTAHLERSLRSVRASLDYYTAHFGPYPYDHLAIVEHPLGLGTGAHADAAMITHGQGFAFWTPADERQLDLPYFVMAHEMGHQWGLPYAMVEGLPFLAEGLATFFAMQVVKEHRGDAQFRRLMAFMRQPFPYRPIRRGEPLLRALDPYMSRRRGPFAMNALVEYVGAERVNGAIRRLIATHDADGAPPVTTLDLLRELRAATPDSLQYLLHDLFEVNAYWQLETTRASATPDEHGGWRVELGVRAHKMAYDSAGAERELSMDEWVPVGIFGAAAEGEDELSAPLHLGLHRIRSGEQTITVTVAREPVLAGIDPYHVLDWEEGEDDDNVERVRVNPGVERR